jgi:hypothetical protein
MDPSQSKSVMKLHVSLEQDSLQYGTCVLNDSVATLCFESKKSLNRNSLVGQCIRGPKIVIHNVKGQ